MQKLPELDEFDLLLEAPVHIQGLRQSPVQLGLQLFVAAPEELEGPHRILDLLAIDLVVHGLVADLHHFL